MPKKIYNKNAREKALLEEAYTSVYNEGVNYSDTSGGAARRAAANRKQLRTAGAVRLQSPEGTSRATLPKDDPKIEELKKQGYTEIPIEDEEGELSDDWMKQDYESRQEERGGDHAKGVKMALEALEMFKDELHIDGHSEDINVNELADAHDQLSRALHWILDETDVEYITGGRATQKAEADSQPEQFTPMEFPHDEY